MRRLPPRRRRSGPALTALLAAVAIAATVAACSTTVQGSAQTVAGASIPTTSQSTAAQTAGGSTTGARTTGATRTSGAGATTTRPADSATSVEPTDIILDPSGHSTVEDTAPQTLPDLPPMGPQVDVTVDGHGVITIARGEPKVVIDEYQDPICPPCARFWEDNGPDLAAAIAGGKVALRLHSVNFLDDRSAFGDYSTRADASLLAVADLAGPNELLLWETVLYSSLVQPYEDDEFDLTSVELGELAQHLGMSQQVTDAITDNTHRKQALAAAATAYDALAKNGRRSVPTTEHNGQLVDTARSSWLADLIGR